MASRQAVVFDLDGTLADTVGDIAAALNRTFEQLGLLPHSEQAVRGMVGGGLTKLFSRALSAHDISLAESDHAAALTRFVDHYAATPAARSRLYPGAGEMLAALREADIACGVCTNKPETIARDLLQALGILDVFGAVQGAGTGFPMKPHPAGLLHVVETLGAQPRTTFMVGDSAADFETARAAGLKGVVLVTYGYAAGPVTELGADCVINHLHDLVPALALPERAQ